MRFLHFLILLSLAGLLAGCPIIDLVDDDDDSAADDDDDQGPIEVAGTWTDGWDFQIIDDALWRLGAWPNNSDHLISQYSNDEDWAVAQNAADHPFSPDLWSRFDWTWHEDAWWMCQTAYDAADEISALATAAADATDPAADGCSGFAWSMLTTDQGPLEIIGQWVDGFGYEHEVRQETWVFDPLGAPSIVWFTQYDNAAGWIIGQNDAVDSWNPDLWSRYDFGYVDDTLHFCQTIYDAPDEATALATPAADLADLDTGCVGFPWSDLLPLP
jgi:hypothetical protein